MATTQRHRFVEFLQRHAPAWLADLFGIKKASCPPPGPQVPQTVLKQIPVIHISNNGVLPPAGAPNGQGNGTTPQPRWPGVRSFSAVLGTDIHTGEEISLTDDAWAQFLTCFGVTGAGKSAFLRGLIKQVIQAGHGLLLLEPHNDLTRQVLADIPRHREKDIVLLDLMDAGEFPFGLSLFECANPSNINEVAKVSSLVMHVLEKTWDVGPHTPLLAQVVRHITFTMVEKGLTLSEIPLLLWDDAVRAKVTSTLKNSHTRLFWQQYNAKSPRDRAEYTSSTVNKLDSYLTQPLLANILCQERSTINLREIMDNGQILLVLLSPQLEEPSRLIGTILLSKLLLAAFSRADIPREEDRRPFYVFADEWHRVASSDFATFIAEARKFRVIIGALATQTLEMLNDANRAAALQSGNLVTFRVSGEDSTVLSKSYDAKPTPALVGEEPIRAPVPDPLSHLLRHGHPHPTVAKFVSDYLMPLDALSSHTSKMPTEHFWAEPANYLHTHVMQARGLLNDTLATCMREGRENVYIPPLILFILGAAVGTGSTCVLAPHCKRLGSLGDYELIGFSNTAKKFGEAEFLKNDQAVSALVQNYATKRVFSAIAGRKILRRPGPAFIGMLTLLRQTMEILAKDPLLTDTGLYQPKYQLRSYHDQENLIANELSTLQNFHARVRLVNGAEHTIRTHQTPSLLSDAQVTARIEAIKQRMFKSGITKDYREVEESVKKRHEALARRPAAVMPPTHTNPNRRRTKPPAVNT
jgi:hypothetical protein